MLRYIRSRVRVRVTIKAITDFVRLVRLIESPEVQTAFAQLARQIEDLFSNLVD